MLSLELQAGGLKEDQREDLWVQRKRNIKFVGARDEDAEDKVRWKRMIGCSTKMENRSRAAVGCF